MDPINYPIKIRKGAPLDIKVTWTDDNGKAKDLSECSASLQVRLSAEDAEPIEDWSSVKGGEIRLGTDGTIQLWVDEKATRAIGWKTGIYDLVLSEEGEEPIRLLEGVAEVE